MIWVIPAAQPYDHIEGSEDQDQADSRLRGLETDDEGEGEAAAEDRDGREGQGDEGGQQEARAPLVVAVQGEDGRHGGEEDGGQEARVWGQGGTRGAGEELTCGSEMAECVDDGVGGGGDDGGQKVAS